MGVGEGVGYIRCRGCGLIVGRSAHNIEVTIVTYIVSLASLVCYHLDEQITHICSIKSCVVSN